MATAILHPLALSSSLSNPARPSTGPYPRHKPATVRATAASPPAAPSLDPAPRWRELAGSKGWAGLTEPFDPVLRSELTRYGELVQACYDSFDFDVFSRYCGQCKYPPSTLLQSAGLYDKGYTITRYLYSTVNADLPNFCRRSKQKDAWSENTNWIGYVAVSGDATSARLGRRDIGVFWRGTVTKVEWLADLKNVQQSLLSVGIPATDPAVKALAGFLDLYTDTDPVDSYSKYSAREQAMAELRRLVKLYAEERGEEVSISLAGHSLGSALATLSAYDLVELGINRKSLKKEIPVCVYSFAGPRVGNDKFKERFEKALGIKSIRVVNVQDLVPKVPGIVFNESMPSILRRVGSVTPWSYTHVGVELQIDHRKSPFLKDDPEGPDVASYHNLEAYLHVLDGYQGKNKEFALVSGRDLALINKSSDFLKDEYMVPPNWRQEGNRGLVRDERGRWAQPERTWSYDFPQDMDVVLRDIGIVKGGGKA